MTPIFAHTWKKIKIEIENWKEVTINNSQEKNCCYEIMGVYHSHCFVCCFQFYCRSLGLHKCNHPLLHSWVVTEAFPYDKFNSAI